MQVDPIKPKLKPPVCKLLKLKWDVPLSNVASKFKLRRYSAASTSAAAAVAAVRAATGAAAAAAVAAGAAVGVAAEAEG